MLSQGGRFRGGGSASLSIFSEAGAPPGSPLGRVYLFAESDPPPLNLPPRIFMTQWDCYQLSGLRRLRRAFALHRFHQFSKITKENSAGARIFNFELFLSKIQRKIPPEAKFFKFERFLSKIQRKIPPEAICLQNSKFSLGGIQRTMPPEAKIPKSRNLSLVKYKGLIRRRRFFSKSQTFP